MGYQFHMVMCVNRFWAKVDKHGPDECWEWTRCKDYDGYGELKANKVHWKAHRFSWTIHFGDIPKGMEVCHKCDNPSCVNPKHLFLADRVGNMQDSVQKGRQGKLTIAEVREIRRRYLAEDITHQELAHMYGVCRVEVANIINRKKFVLI